jgi:hypothetical protein
MQITGARLAAVALALTIAAAGALPAGPSYAGQDRAGQERSGAATGAPNVGTCSTMTVAQADAPTDHSTVVDCSQRHNAQVAGVVRLPKRLQWTNASPRDLMRVIAARCEPDVQMTLGRDMGTRDSSAYEYVWFVPGKAQRAAGARWLSCSVVRPRASGLAALPTSTAPFLPSGTLPDPLARCLTRSVLDTPCSARHLWRATGTFAMSGSFPGQKALARKARSKCPSRVTGGETFRWSARNRFSWNLAHDHVVVCYSRTRH